MNILLFLPSSFKANDILSLALFLKKNGHIPIFLSSTPKGDLHIYFKKYEISSFSLNIVKLNFSTYLYACVKLAQFIKMKNIELILSNNLQGNFVAVLSQFIHGKRTVLTRHHHDYIYKGDNKNAKRQQWFVNRFGKEFIAISERVKLQMVKEGIAPEKIHRVNLGFDFNLFPQPDQKVVDELKENNLDSFKLCVVARLIPLKRHELLFDTVRILHDNGMKIVLWVVGNGPLMKELKEWVRFYRLEKVILFTGYINDPENYLAASDLLVHVSESEASSHVVRETGLVNTPVLVCRGVGDFENFIINGKSGFLINMYFQAKELADEIMELSDQKELLIKNAQFLKNTVLDRFDINNSGKQMLKIIENE